MGNLEVVDEGGRGGGLDCWCTGLVSLGKGGFGGFVLGRVGVVEGKGFWNFGLESFILDSMSLARPIAWEML
jgi:hypothetical protein